MAEDNNEFKHLIELLKLELENTKSDYFKIEKIIKDAAHAITIFLSVSLIKQRLHFIKF